MPEIPLLEQKQAEFGRSQQFLPQNRTQPSHSAHIKGQNTTVEYYKSLSCPAKQVIHQRLHFGLQGEAVFGHGL
jgi:hypothetical protein